MIKEVRKFIRKEFSFFKPSAELVEYIKTTLRGKNPDIPSYGCKDAIFDYYGVDNEGAERARFRIPWARGKLEKSYHITRTMNGFYKVVNEGIFPFNG